VPISPLKEEMVTRIISKKQVKRKCKDKSDSIIVKKNNSEKSETITCRMGENL